LVEDDHGKKERTKLRLASTGKIFIVAVVHTAFESDWLNLMIMEKEGTKLRLAPNFSPIFSTCYEL
jgi:hypothetical protein